MPHKIIMSGLLAALVLGCAGQRDNVVETPREKEISYETQSFWATQPPSWWTPPRDVPIEYIDINRMRIRIYRGEIESMQTFRIGDDRSPIWCGSKWDFKYFVEKGENAIYQNH